MEKEKLVWMIPDVWEDLKEDIFLRLEYDLGDPVTYTMICEIMQLMDRYDTK